MRFTASFTFAFGIVLTVFACSADDATPAPADPTTTDGGGTSSSGSTDEGGSSSGSTSSSGATDAADATEPEVKYVDTTTVKMQHDGVERTYVLSVPTDYDATKKYPLFIWLHGDPGNALSASAERIDRVTKNEAIIAYPGALGSGWDHTAAEQDNPDTTFIFAMIDAIDASKSIDKNRILLAGWSSGGFMASLMACRLSSSFRAIAIEAGGAPFDINGGDENPACDGAAIATVVTHGGQDNTVGPTSGLYAAEYWQDHNGCNGSKAAGQPPPCEDYAGCPNDKPVRYCLEPNAGHGVLANAHAIEWAWFKALP